jgi:hypothetical protein
MSYLSVKNGLPKASRRLVLLKGGWSPPYSWGRILAGRHLEYAEQYKFLVFVNNYTRQTCAKMRINSHFKHVQNNLKSISTPQVQVLYEYRSTKNEMKIKYQ